jgi:hypothetical protein
MLIRNAEHYQTMTASNFFPFCNLERLHRTCATYKKKGCCENDERFECFTHSYPPF